MKASSRVFICQIIPGDLIVKYHASQAGNNFCKNIISTGGFSKVYSMVPVHIGPRIIKECHSEGTEYLQVRCFPHRGIGRYLNALIENFQVIRKVLHADAIWFYNVTSYNMIAYIFLRCILRRNVFVLLADFTPPKSGLDVQAIIGWCLKRALGVISLSGRLTLKIGNLKVIPGIIPRKNVKKPQMCPERRFLFSGTLNSVTGIEMAVAAFSELPDVKLLVTGNGNPECLQDIGLKHENIEFLGNLSFAEYQKIMDSSAWALNLRNPRLPENQNNFPSKMLEYLSCGKLVLSTMKYSEMEGIKYFTAEYEKEEVKKQIRRIAALSPEEIKAIQSYNYAAIDSFSEQVWISAFEEIEKNALAD